MKDNGTPKPDAEKFGQYLRKVRDRNSRSQMELAVELVNNLGIADAEKDKAGKNWQSFIARAELGTGTVRPEQLCLLAKVYEEPLERLASAYLATHVFLGSPLPKFLDEKPFKQTDWQAPANFFASSAVEVWSLEEIRTWERNIVDQTKEGVRPELWIVSPEFVDHKNEEFLKVVVDHLLLKQADLTYFVADRDTPADEDFGWFLDRVAMRVQNTFRDNGKQLSESSIGSISVYGLTAEELTWFTSSLVIANPKEFQGGASGVSAFTIVSVDGEHMFGIPVHSRELSGIVSSINRQITRRQRDNSEWEKGSHGPNDRKPPTYERDVLKKKLFP